MLDFGFYCDLSECISEHRKNIATTLDNCCMLVSPSPMENEQAMMALINCCDIKTLNSLVDYFDNDHPIQNLLTKRKQELSGWKCGENLSYEIKKSKESFYLYLCDVMEKKQFLTDADFYNHINMSRQTFAKIRNTNTISRNHALLMAVGLRLNYVEAVEFLSKAGYSFRDTVTREVIISYVMKNMEYDLYRMEEILMDFGEASLIGGV